MAPDPQGTHAAGPDENPTLTPVIPHPDGPYDRSSLRGDFLVMIPGQTEEEYLRRRPEGGRCEFIGGVVYMHAAAEKQHQSDVSLLSFILQGFVTVHDAGIVLLGPSALRLGPDRYVEPDLFVMPTEAGAQVDPMYWHPPALLVIEVLSRTTRDIDLDEKSALYREAGTPEIWFIDHRDRVVIVERRTIGGITHRRVAAGPHHSTALPGFWFDVDWLWAEPRPNLMRCLDQILAGPPDP